MREIILASASKRRSEILASCGITHTILPSNVDEIDKDKGPVEEIVRQNAILKAGKAAENSDDAVIISADTLVAHGDLVIGKPKDEEEAKDILSRFSGETIKVCTGICVMDCASGNTVTDVDISEVRVTDMDGKEVEKYFALLGPYDKAGGFSIEGIGSMIFDDIKGSYFNILGLSMMKIKSLFEDTGLDIFDYIDKDKVERI